MVPSWSCHNSTHWMSQNTPVSSFCHRSTWNVLQLTMGLRCLFITATPSALTHCTFLVQLREKDSGCLGATPSWQYRQALDSSALRRQQRRAVRIPQRPGSYTLTAVPSILAEHPGEWANGPAVGSCSTQHKHEYQLSVLSSDGVLLTPSKSISHMSAQFYRAIDFYFCAY